MLLKLKIAAARQHAPASQVWSSVVAYFRARRQRTRDRRILSHMNDHILRDIGLKPIHLQSARPGLKPNYLKVRGRNAFGTAPI